MTLPAHRKTLTALERQQRHEKAKAIREARRAKEVSIAPPKQNVLRYDYGQIDEAHREMVQTAALDIKRRLKRTVEDMIEIGLRLTEVKQLFPGKFNDWIAAEFSMSRRTAFEFRNVADRFADKSAIIALLSPTIVRLLAAPSVPDELASAVIELNQARLQDDMPALMVREVKEIKRQMTGSGNPPGRGAKQLPPPPSEPEIIEAEYTVIAPAQALSFAEWLAAMPNDLCLRDHLAILALAKTTALRALGDHPQLYNAVYGALPTWSALLREIEKELKR